MDDRTQLTDDGAGREGRLAAAFVTLADTMVDEFDMIDLLALLADYCVDLVGSTASGILLMDQRGALGIAAASSAAARVVELFELQQEQGPCYDCCRTGTAISEPDIARASARWPEFSARVAEVGFAAVHALPLRLRGQVIGALNLFHAEPGRLRPTQAALAQALADVATIGILQERALRERELLAEQLQTALNSRIVVEQAKGIIAERTGLDTDAAFTLMRTTARSRQRRLAEFARDIVQGIEDLGMQPSPGER